MKVQCKQLDDQPDHRRVIEMAEIRELSVCPIVNLIITKLDKTCDKTTD